MTKRKIIKDEWRGCYPSSWKGVIVPEAMSHPAKYSSKLIRRIYEHMLEEKWVSAGDNVLDPFGGVALGALDAMRLGLHWTGMELEEKFFNLGNENISKWATQYRTMPNWGSARLLHGDSRNLLSVIGESVRVSVSSPPYAEISTGGGKEGVKKHGTGLTQGEACFGEYGASDGQLGAMPAQQFEAAISSPPYGKDVEPHGDLRPGKDGVSPENQLRGYRAAISSPPYAETDLQYKKNGLKVDGKDKYERPYMDGQGNENYGSTTGQLGGMKNTGFEASVSSPPYNPPMSQEHNGKRGGDRGTTPSEPGAFVRYGNTEGQLEGMNMEGFAGAVSSPPFMDNNVNIGSVGDTPAMRQQIGDSHKRDNSYGITTGQLGSMPADGFDAAVSSPPFEANPQSKERLDGKHLTTRTNPRHEGEKLYFVDYATQSAEGSLATETGADFWLAARAIVEQVYQALTPGGHAVWVVKDYVKNKSIVPFSDQWRQLCEAVGFQTIHEHHAMLVHHKGTQHLLEGGTVEKKTESKSFFRRLAEKKGSPRIDFETVFCMVKK